VHQLHAVSICNSDTIIVKGEKEKGVDLPTDACAIASGKTSEVAPDTDNLDLVNICDMTRHHMHH